mgnify:CR=1 FL=1
MTIYAIADNTNDGSVKNAVWDYNALPSYANDKYFKVADPVKGDDDGGIRFVNITETGTVSSAILTLYRYNQDGVDITLKVYADDVDNAPAFDNASNPQVGWTNTTASSSFTILDADAANTAYNIDVTAIVQEILDRAGWVSGNSIRFSVVFDSGASYNEAKIHDSGAAIALGFEPKLEIVAGSSDTTLPVITLLGSTPVSVNQNATYTDAGATASDDTDGDITANIVTVNPVNTAILGAYTVTYNVDDAASNSAVEVTRTVNVVDGTAPTFTAQSFNYNENQTTGATVATLSASDTNGVTSFIFTSTGTQTSSDTFFSIDNAGVITITAAGVASDHNDFETGLNSVVHSVTAGDAALNTTASNITLNVLDVDDTSPVLTGVSAGTITQTSVTPTCSTNENTGTMYVVRVPDGDSPSVTQIIAGQQSSGAAALDSDFDTISATGVHTFAAMTGITGNTAGELFFAHVDAASNESSAISVGFTTLSATATFSTDAISATLDVVLFDGAVETFPAILKTFNDATTDGSGNLSLDLNDVTVTASQAVEGIAKDTTSNYPLPIQSTVSIA